MTKKEIIKRLKNNLETLPDKDNLDLSDYANEIGYTLAYYMNHVTNDKKAGWDKNDFLSGFNHGVSLVDGTHKS